MKKEANAWIVSLVGANSKKAKEDFVKSIRAAAVKELDSLRDIRAHHIADIKKYKDLIPKDVVFNAEKQIHELFTAYTKQLNDAVNAKVKQVEAAK